MKDDIFKQKVALLMRDLCYLAMNNNAEYEKHECYTLTALTAALIKDYDTLQNYPFWTTFKMVEECTEARDATNIADFVYEIIQAFDVAHVNIVNVPAALSSRLGSDLKIFFSKHIDKKEFQKAVMRALSRTEYYGQLNWNRVHFYQEMDSRSNVQFLPIYVISSR